MERNHFTSARRNADRKLSSDHLRALLDVITAIQWDLQRGIRDGVVYPDGWVHDVERAWDDIDESAVNLKAIIRGRVQTT